MAENRGQKSDDGKQNTIQAPSVSEGTKKSNTQYDIERSESPTNIGIRNTNSEGWQPQAKLGDGANAIRHTISDILHTKPRAWRNWQTRQV
ncbi:MAG: hypothetical protein ACYS8Z_19890 [Planctomycetota bacterium]